MRTPCFGRFSDAWADECPVTGELSLRPEHQNRNEERHMSVKRKARRWKGWAVKWRSRNRINGENSHLICDPIGIVKLFKTRLEARAYAQLKYGYIKLRPDLQREPHGWRFPTAVTVEVVEILPKLGKK